MSDPFSQEIEQWIGGGNLAVQQQPADELEQQLQQWGLPLDRGEDFGPEVDDQAAGRLEAIMSDPMQALDSAEYLPGERIIAAMEHYRQRESFAGGKTFDDPTAGWWERNMGDLGAVKKLPFASGFVGVTESADLVRRMAKAKGGTATGDDYLILGRYLVEREREGRAHDETWFEGFMDTLTEMPGFAIEFAATQGAYTAAKQAVLRRATSWSAEVVASRAAGLAAQTAVNPRWVAGGVERMIPEFDGREIGDSPTIRSGVHDLLLGYADQYIETLSERSGARLSGGLVRGAGGLARGARAVAPKSLQRAADSTADAMKGYLFGWWTTRNPGVKYSAIKEMAKTSGWDGMFEEWLEERFGETIRGVVPGLQHNPFGATGDFVESIATANPELMHEALKQFSQEAVAFLIPGLAVAGGRALEQQSLQHPGEVPEAAELSDEDMWSRDVAEFLVDVDPRVHRLAQTARPVPSQREWEEAGLPSPPSRKIRQQFAGWIRERMSDPHQGMTVKPGHPSPAPTRPVLERTPLVPPSREEEVPDPATDAAIADDIELDPRPTPAVSVESPESLEPPPSVDFDSLRRRVKENWGDDVEISLVSADDLTDEQRDASRFMEERGIRHEWVRSPGGGILPFRGLTDRNQGDVVLLDSRQADETLWHTIGDETAHAIGLDRRTDIFPQHLVDESAQRYLDRQRRAGGDRRVAMLESRPELLAEEARAQLVADLLSDQQFRRDLQQEEPSFFKRIVTWILDVVGGFSPKDPVRHAVMEELRAAIGRSPQQPEDLKAVGEAGSAIVDNFYEAVRQSLVDSGKVPTPEQNSSVGKAWDAWPDKQDVDGFVSSLRAGSKLDRPPGEPGDETFQEAAAASREPRREKKPVDPAHQTLIDKVEAESRKHGIPSPASDRLSPRELQEWVEFYNALPKPRSHKTIAEDIWDRYVGFNSDTASDDELIAKAGELWSQMSRDYQKENPKPVDAVDAYQFIEFFIEDTVGISLEADESFREGRTGSTFQHRRLVEAALDRGDTVPEEVLEDYPDLQEWVQAGQEGPRPGGRRRTTYAHTPQSDELTYQQQKRLAEEPEPDQVREERQPNYDALLAEAIRSNAPPEELEKILLAKMRAASNADAAAQAPQAKPERQTFSLSSTPEPPPSQARTDDEMRELLERWTDVLSHRPRTFSAGDIEVLTQYVDGEHSADWEKFVFNRRFTATPNPSATGADDALIGRLLQLKTLGLSPPAKRQAQRWPHLAEIVGITYPTKKELSKNRKSLDEKVAFLDSLGIPVDGVRTHRHADELMRLPSQVQRVLELFQRSPYVSRFTGENRKYEEAFDLLFNRGVINYHEPSGTFWLPETHLMLAIRSAVTDAAASQIDTAAQRAYSELTPLLKDRDSRGFQWSHEGFLDPGQWEKYGNSIRHKSWPKKRRSPRKRPPAGAIDVIESPGAKKQREAEEKKAGEPGGAFGQALKDFGKSARNAIEGKDDDGLRLSPADRGAADYFNPELAAKAANLVRVGYQQGVHRWDDFVEAVYKHAMDENLEHILQLENMLRLGWNEWRSTVNQTEDLAQLDEPRPVRKVLEERGHVDAESPKELPAEADGGAARPGGGGGVGSLGSPEDADAERPGPGRSDSADDPDVRDESPDPSNYRYTEAAAAAVERPPKERARANLRAIQTLKTLEEQGRQASAQEKEALAQFVGWGGLKQLFSTAKTANWTKQWKAMHDELRELLTPTEWASAEASTPNAHYTPPAVARAMWEALEAAGFEGGRVLEPAMGTGIFFGMMPPAIEGRSQLHGIEKDDITFRIARHLYRSARLQHGPTQEQTLRDDYDLVIGNPPFGKVPITDLEDKHLHKLTIHNWFVGKGLEKLRPGGILAVVVSRYAIDAKDRRPRTEWAKSGGDFLGAVRLPETTFAGMAGSAVITDILVFQKRHPGEKPAHVPSGHRQWEGGRYTSAYWDEHPDHVLGTMDDTGTTRGKADITVKADDKAVPPRVRDLIAGFLENRVSATATIDSNTEELQGGDEVDPGRDPRDGPLAPEHLVHTNLFIRDGKLFQKWFDGTRELPVPTTAKKPDARKRSQAKFLEKLGAIPSIRDAADALLATEEDPEASAERIAELRRLLNERYDAFAQKYPGTRKGKRTPGSLHKWAKLFVEDEAGRGLLLALEDYDSDTGKARKSPLFTSRQLVPTGAVAADNSRDAMLASLNQYGRIDVPYMSKLVGKRPAEIEEELTEKSLAFVNPISGEWQPPDVYLSGNVRRKLKEAEEAQASRVAEGIRRDYTSNIEALRRALPKDIEPADISVQLGAPWLPTQTFVAVVRKPQSIRRRRQFLNELLLFRFGQEEELRRTVLLGGLV